MLALSSHWRRRTIALLTACVALSLLACNLLPTAMPQVPTPTPVRVVQPTATPWPTPPVPTSTPTPKTLCVSADGDGVFVRSEPIMEKKVKAWPDGTRMLVLEESPAEWAKVRAPDDYTGYVPRKYLVACPTPAPQPTATLRQAPTASPTP